MTWDGPATKLWETREQQVAEIGERITCDSPGCPHTALWGCGTDEDFRLYCEGHKYLAEEEPTL